MRSSAKDVQVSVVALTDLLPNLWMQALSINNTGNEIRIVATNPEIQLPVRTRRYRLKQFAQYNGQWK